MSFESKSIECEGCADESNPPGSSLLRRTMSGKLISRIVRRLRAFKAHHQHERYQSNFYNWSSWNSIRLPFLSGSEELMEKEISIVACGAVIPAAWRGQAATCFLKESGNGGEYIFDIVTG